MNQRFIIITFAASIFMFAAIFALTAPATHSEAPPATSPIASELYSDCDAVRAAGAAPLRMGQPGYRAALDANMNGIACETVGPPITSAPDAPQPSAPPPPEDPTPSQSSEPETTPAQILTPQI